MFASAKGKKQKQVRQLQCQEHCNDHIPYYLSGLPRAQFLDNLSRNSCILKQLFTSISLNCGLMNVYISPSQLFKQSASINTLFHCFGQVIIFNKWKGRSLRRNRRSLLRIIAYCPTSVTTIMTCRFQNKRMVH